MEKRLRRSGDDKRSYFRHPLAAVGGAIFAAGIALFVVLFLVDMTAGDSNPYRALVTFIGSPTLCGLGVFLLFVSIRLQIRSARKAGENVKFDFSVIPYDTTKRWNFWLFLVLSFVLISGVVYSGYRGYEVTDSVEFCGETCHEVMHPQSVTYKNSPHARVPCVECHIGPGASFWVQAKVDGLRQVVAAVMNTFDRPIHTPVQNLRPAQETCEGCHWPRQFYGQKMVTRTYYRTDEENSPWTIKLLVKIGGGNPRTGGLEGIHWHMLGENTIEYIATDEKRGEIPWVRMTKANGEEHIYTDPDASPEEIPDPNDPNVEIRKFDCMDCHNRPSHSFEPPAKSLNLALSTQRIPRDLPSIREVGLRLLLDEYETTEAAMDGIRSGLVSFYQEELPEVFESRLEEIESTGKQLQTIYKRNFFPEMKTDFRARENYLSHFVNDGCFRCHDGQKETQWGEKLSSGCNSCHLIIAQGPSDDDQNLASDIAGLEFQHPEDIDQAWKEMKCTECHTPEAGY
ncbi:MAG: NapC/NirT family cytochrome c [bacterium]|nr:NapC/NirT family cytochrome c [bacterium]